jgi:hypothetical protein
MILRPTNARFRKRVAFWGIEGGVLPLVISVTVSAILGVLASSPFRWWAMAIAVSPFVLTFGYMRLFLTNRQPHFAGDLLNLWCNGRSVSPSPSSRQPQHPIVKKLARGVRDAT